MTLFLLFLAVTATHSALAVRLARRSVPPAPRPVVPKPRYLDDDRW